MVTRGFRRKHAANADERTPPGQYVTDGFPVLSTGPTPRVDLTTWALTLEGPDGGELYRCTWDALRSLQATEVVVDIHCVTKWSKLDTRWKGVSFDTLMSAAGVAPPTEYVMAFCDGGYTTNLSVSDLRTANVLVAYEHDGAPIPAAHGGPVRLVVPHLYFWKSAKWLRGLRFMEANQPGFWEAHGYHLRGDPWKEQRYHGD